MITAQTARRTTASSLVRLGPKIVEEKSSFSDGIVNLTQEETT
jgi:hypothetical protein